MARRAARIDANHREICLALEKAGCTVEDLSRVGKGVPDILVGVARLNILMEIKDGAKPPSRRELNPTQKVWHAKWRGQVAKVESVEEAIEIINAIRRGE